MFEWLRRLPHPKYGKCGGKGRDCSISKPIDALDAAFDMHDDDLYEADLEKDPVKQKSLRQIADKNLAIRMKKIDPKTLKWKGRLYRRMALLVFKP